VTDRSDGRLHSEACARNRDPIGDALALILPPSGTVLEIGAGTGQHAVFFSRRFPALSWQPLDRPEWLGSITAWRDAEGPPNLHAPVRFDLYDPELPDAVMAKAPFAALVSINVLHIAPAAATAHLFRHALAVLPPEAPVFVYGPFIDPTRPLEPSNAAFDAFLRRRDPESGLRSVTDVDATARSFGYRLEADQPMPANNRARWWRRTPSS